LGGYGKKAFHKPPQALARKRWWQAILTLRENTKVPAFRSRFLATLLEDCYWKVVLKKLL
jgi:hypothetical protein